MFPMKRSYLFLLALLFCAFLIGPQPDAFARVYLDFSSPNFKKVPIAVPVFVSQTKSELSIETGKRMADLLARGLEFHGFIEIIPLMSSNVSQEYDWQNLGADFVIYGKYSLVGDDISLEIRLVDVLENRLIFGRKYNGPTSKEREMILKYCDEVIKQLTGEEGISRSSIAFTSDLSGFQEVYLADVLGDSTRQITKHRKLVVSPRFSPSGKRLVYTSYHSGNPNLYLTDLSQSRVTRAISQRPGLNLAPAWSPDGKTLAITLSKDGNPDLYLMDTKGEIRKRLTNRAGINVSPSWAPDGRSLAFVSDRSGTPQIYVMTVNTLRTTRVTFNGNDNSEPAWSPDGKLIAYTSLSDGSYHVFIIKPDGSKPKRLTRFAGDHESPNWSPDGNQIVFSRSLDSKQMLYIIFKNGAGLRRLYPNLDGNQKYPQWSSNSAH